MTETIGFIGLGHMGGAMARRLVEAGCDLIGFDTDAQRVASLGDGRVRRAASAREVADAAPIVFACLPSQAASLGVSEEVAAGGAVRIHVECSTIGVATIKAISERLGARGISVLDAPVSGGPKGAAAGTLALIVSGPAEAIASARPALAHLSREIKIVGDRPGQAQTCKIVNNAISICAMVVTCEAVVAGVAAGVDGNTLIDVMNVSTGRTSASVDKFPKAILPRSFDYGGSIDIGNKDLALYLDHARAMGLSGEVIERVAAIWRDATDRLGSAADYSEVVKIFEARAGAEVRGHNKEEAT
ncbi:MAG: NAD(P)-dependent oxidoreductase [Acidisphaera sp.]|nr:NAD(P)-dependent oxidoreductase [Acidisphaera sp.]MBV9813607.1 NAD(P)-dependent oxidoreductase [Acetobacteraceae bacterium]